MKKTMILLALALLIASSMAFAEGDKVFSDLSASHWARGHIEDLFGREIISGYPDGTFKPEDNVRVNEFLAMTLRGIGYHLESKSSDWAKPYVDKAIELGVIEDKEFPQYTAFITRQQMASVIVNTIALKDLKLPSSTDAYVIRNMKDYHLVEDYYKQNVIESYKAGIITGYPDGTFRPEGLATRAEASKVLITFLEPDKRQPFEDADAEKITVTVKRYYDINGNQIHQDDYKTEIYEKKEVQVDLYAPIHNGQPVNEIIELARVLKELEKDTTKGYTSFSYGQFAQVMGINGYRSKDYHDSVFDIEKVIYQSFAIAERTDFVFDVDFTNLGHKYRPYDLVIWKKSQNMNGEATYADYFKNTYEDKFRVIFQTIFKEDFEEFWALFQEGIAYEKYQNAETIYKELEIGGRHVYIHYDNGGLGLTISLKR